MADESEDKGDVIKERLWNLAMFLDDEGWYTKRNTAYNALIYIGQLEDQLAQVGKRVFS